MKVNNENIVQKLTLAQVSCFSTNGKITTIVIESTNEFAYLMHAPLLFQATDTRDALAKSVYASLFEWLVEQINKSLSVGKRRTGRSISILDIYGFESFDVMYFLLN
jgi:myosin heavy subunit